MAGIFNIGAGSFVGSALSQLGGQFGPAGGGFLSGLGGSSTFLGGGLGGGFGGGFSGGLGGGISAGSSYFPSYNDLDFSSPFDVTGSDFDMFGSSNFFGSRSFGLSSAFEGLSRTVGQQSRQYFQDVVYDPLDEGPPQIGTGKKKGFPKIKPIKFKDINRFNDNLLKPLLEAGLSSLARSAQVLDDRRTRGPRIVAKGFGNLAKRIANAPNKTYGVNGILIAKHNLDTEVVNNLARPIPVDIDGLADNEPYVFVHRSYGSSLASQRTTLESVADTEEMVSITEDVSNQSFVLAGR